MKRRTSLTNAEIVGTIRFLCFVAAIAVNLGGSAAFALDLMGPPRAAVEQSQFSTGSAFSRNGMNSTPFILDPLRQPLASEEQRHFSVGTEFSLSKMDLELSNGKWVNPNFDPASGDPGSKTIKDFETIKLYTTVGYGFAKNWEGFLGIGAAKAEFGDELWAQGEDFDSGIGLGIRGGIKATIFEIPEYNLQIGGLLQVNWANYDGKLDVPQQAGPDFVEVNLSEMQIAVGATYLWAEGFTVYGGPFVHYISGDLESSTVEGFDITWDVDQGPSYGGYLGAMVDLGVWMDLAQDCFFSIEYQHSTDASALGAGLMLRY